MNKNSATSIVLAASILFAISACNRDQAVVAEKRKFEMPAEQIVGPPSVVVQNRKDFRPENVRYMDGSVYGNGFTNMQLSIEKVGDSAEFILRFGTSSGGWHTQNPKEPFPVTIELLNSNREVLDQVALGLVNIPCSVTYNNKLQTQAPKIGRIFDQISFVRVRPDLWLQTIDSC